MAIPNPCFIQITPHLPGNQHFFSPTQQKNQSKLMVTESEDTSERHLCLVQISLVIKQKQFTKPEERG